MANSESSTRRNLTDKFIQSIKPTDRRVTYWDATEPGLGLVVQPSGYRSFVVVRRIRGGGPVKYVIQPSYPTMTLALAREKAQQVKRDLRNGINTREEERKADAERERLKTEEVRVSFTTVAEAYISKKLIGLRTAKGIEHCIRRDILSRPWSKKPVTAVSKADIVGMIRDIVADQDRTTPGQWSTAAKRAFDYTRQIRTFMNWSNKLIIQELTITMFRPRRSMGGIYMRPFLVGYRSNRRRRLQYWGAMVPEKVRSLKFSREI